MQVRGMLGVPLAHMPLLTWCVLTLHCSSQEEVFAECVGQQHLVLPMFKFKAGLLTCSLSISHYLDRSNETAAAVQVAFSVAYLTLPV